MTEPIPSQEITRLLGAWQEGDEKALDDVTPYVYSELQKLAASHMRRENAGHTLQATALVNEAFIRLAGSKLNFDSRRHFYGVASNIMRRLLVDHARTGKRQKRGGGAVHITLQEAIVPGQTHSSDILDLDRALDELAGFDARMSKAIELLYFGGLNYDEVAKCLKVSRSTLFSDVKLAKAWLRNQMD